MVEFNMENIRRCLCPGCPVGRKYVRTGKIKQIKRRKWGNPSPEDVPGAYCATEKATCEGLDPK